MRRLQLASIALIAAAAVLTHAASRPAVQRTGPPNILLIQADDLGYGDLSVYGQTRFATPNLDRLAREGTQVHPVLRRQHRLRSVARRAHDRQAHRPRRDPRQRLAGRRRRAAPADEVTIAEVLSDAGYRTAIIGKWGLGQPGTTGPPDKQGFDYSFRFPRSPARASPVHGSSLAERRKVSHRPRPRLRQRPVHQGSGRIYRTPPTRGRSSST